MLTASHLIVDAKKCTPGLVSVVPNASRVVTQEVRLGNGARTSEQKKPHHWDSNIAQGIANIVIAKRKREVYGQILSFRLISPTNYTV